MILGGPVSEPSGLHLKGFQGPAKKNSAVLLQALASRPLLLLGLCSADEVLLEVSTTCSQAFQKNGDGGDTYQY